MAEAWESAAELLIRLRAQQGRSLHLTRHLHAVPRRDMADTPDYDREGAQPPPTWVLGAVSSHNQVIEDLRLYYSSWPGVTLAAKGMISRREYGLRKYATVLHAGNGRDHLADVLDETEDKAAYLRTAFEHDPELRKTFWEDYIAELGFLVRLRQFLSERTVQNPDPPDVIAEQGS